MREPVLNRIRFWVPCAAFWVTAFTANQAQAAVPPRLNYQGYVTSPSTGQPINAPVGSPLSMNFKLYTALTGGAPVYSETQPVAVSNGVFNV